MTLSEAIYTIKNHLDGNPNLKDTGLRRAMHLSVKACERVKWERTWSPDFFGALLKGETKE